MKKITRAFAAVPLLLALMVPTVTSADIGGSHHHFHMPSRQGTLIVVKKTTGGNGTFQMSGDAGNFSITTHRHFGVKVLRVDAGSYSVSEAEQSGWEQVSNSCDDVTVRAHRTSICTIVNQITEEDGDDDEGSNTGTLDIVINTIGGDDTFSFTSAAGDFSVTTSGGTAVHEITNVPVGLYSVVQNPMEGWNQTGFCDSVEVVSDETVTCTITNEKVIQTGSIAVIKNTVGGDGTFSFSGNGLTPFDITTLEGAGEEDIYEVPVGSYTLTETAAEGWTLTSNSCAEGMSVTANATTTCTVVNTKNATTSAGGDTGGGSGETGNGSNTATTGGSTGGNGPIAGSLGGGGSIVPAGNGPISGQGGQVLGASTTTLPELPAGCTALINSYMRMGKHNDSIEVKKLQKFLGENLGLDLPITGFFGASTDAAVRQFQVAHNPEILKPWGISDSTGYVYKTTQRWINLMSCSSLNLPMPELN